MLDQDHADNNGLLISAKRSGLVILENAGSRKGMTMIHRGIPMQIDLDPVPTDPSRLIEGDAFDVD